MWKGRPGFSPKDDDEVKERMSDIYCEVKNGHPQFSHKQEKRDVQNRVLRNTQPGEASS